MNSFKSILDSLLHIYIYVSIYFLIFVKTTPIRRSRKMFEFNAISIALSTPFFSSGEANQTNSSVNSFKDTNPSILPRSSRGRGRGGGLGRGLSSLLGHVLRRRRSTDGDTACRHRGTHPGHHRTTTSFSCYHKKTRSTRIRQTVRHNLPLFPATLHW